MKRLRACLRNTLPLLLWRGGLGRGGPLLTRSRFRHALKPLLPIASVAFAFQPGSLMACAACYGQSDSPMAQGMNWGIFSLLAVIVSVLGSIGGFFIFLARKSASPANQPVLLNQSPN